ncbi:MRS2 [Candida oxycetoniae]|uniref:Magnesium transporter n=1 Tax=Candida oxycetoniae TaxID=497107 RepID=A0AAI9SUN0_9ASCO|nr:MRS2 [Candida oxycetoniae]KAI3403221.2 MRS2 [Candida oxycetoniae]
MQAFIEKEAKEKAKEIRLKADEEYEIEKASTVRLETAAIDTTYEQKLKKASLAQQITKSTIGNKTRLRILGEKDQILNQIFDDAEAELKKITQDKEKYKPILVGLIEEGALTLLEAKISIKVRKQDLDISKEAVSEATRNYEDKTKGKIEISVNKDEFLSKDIAGGVVVTNETGKIEVDNTLEERLKILSEEALPALRLEFHIIINRLKPIQPNDLYVSCTIFDSKGNITAVSKKYPKMQFLKENHLYPRDLRKIDTSSIDVIPMIMIRSSNAILVNLLYIKAIIKKNSVMVFDTSNPEVASKLGIFMYDLEQKLKSSSSPSLPYEFRALESILVSIMSYLEAEIKLYINSCGMILSELEDEVYRKKLQELLIRSKQLSSFHQKAVLIRNVLEDLLENDEDLAGMYLSDPKKKPVDDHVSKSKDIVDEQVNENLNNYEDLEMILESYYRQCDEFVQQAGSLLNDIKATEDIVNIILDANRNSLMLFELKVTVYTLGITIATLIPAFYGMNLKNYIENSNYGFGAVVVFSILQGMVFTWFNFKKLHKVQKLTILGTNSNPKKKVITPYKSTINRDSSFLHKLFFGSGSYRKKKYHWPNKSEKDLIWKMINDDKSRK